MKTINRIKKYIDYKSIKLGWFDQKIGTGVGYIGKQIKRNASVGSDIIEKILFEFNEINAEWLLTGKGPMLRPVDGSGAQVLEGIQPNQPTGMSVQSQEVMAYSSDSKEKDFIIERLRNQVQTLDAQLTDKDKQIEALERQIKGLKAGFENQIEDLKNNLGMVIASKDEMLAMKNQILEIQAEKIAELEDFKKMQEQRAFKQKRA